MLIGRSRRWPAPAVSRCRPDQTVKSCTESTRWRIPGDTGLFPSVGIAAGRARRKAWQEGDPGQSSLYLPEQQAGEGHANTQEAPPGPLLIERMYFYHPAVKFRGPADSSVPAQDGDGSAGQAWRPGGALRGLGRHVKGDHGYLLKF